MEEFEEQAHGPREMASLQPLGAADTFRAAAVEQIAIWGERFKK